MFGTTRRRAELKQRSISGSANNREGKTVSERTFTDITDDVDALLNDAKLAPAIAEHRSEKLFGKFVQLENLIGW
jgi:hypothetical protein